jgi:hypothetical protein
MREIMEVAKYIRKELKLADEFAYEANKHREQYPDMAQHYYRVANEHLNMCDELHNGAVRLIENHRRTDGEPPAEMLRMWSFEHEMMMDEKECVLRKLNMFKG